MGLFDIFKNGLQKTRAFVSTGFQRLAAQMGYFDEDMLDELEMLLIQADCGTDCASQILAQVRQDIKRSGNNKAEAVLKSVKEAMLEILHSAEPLSVEAKQLTIILMVGVNGSGKTTTSGKLAYKYKAAGKKVLLAAADTFRAAAIEQLQQWGERANVAVIANSSGCDPAAVVYDALQAALSRHSELLIIDTAGRLHNKQNLMDELAKIRRIIQREAPDARVYSLLTLDATTGQNAVYQAQAFHEVTELNGLILSKLDGNAKGGIALAVAKQNKLPVLLVGLGEGIEDLQEFQADIFVESLLPSELVN